MSKSASQGGSVTFIGPDGPVDPSLKSLPPEVHAKLMRLISGQRMALANFDTQNQPQLAAEAVASALAAAEGHMRRHGGEVAK